MNFVADITVTIAGVLFPALATYKSLQQKSQQNRLIWLRYWVVFSLYYAVKTIGDLILSWLPFYHVVQILLVLWISSSKASGAQVLYLYAVVPILRDREQAIDRFISRHKRDASVLFWKGASELGLRWSSTFCHIVRLYFEASLAANSVPALTAGQSVPAADVCQEMSETESTAIRTDLPADEDMFSDDDNELAGGETSLSENPAPDTPRRRSGRRAKKRNTSTKGDCNFNVAGDD